MNQNSIQRAIFNELLKGNRVGYADLTNDDVIVTEGRYGVVLNKAHIKFNLAQCVNMPEITLQMQLDVKDNDKQLQKGNEIFMMANGDIVRRLFAEEFEVWVKTKYLDMFDANSIMGHSPTGRVLFFGDMGNLLGVALPVRMGVTLSAKKAV